jgi:hypothetical protein
MWMVYKWKIQLLWICLSCNQVAHCQCRKTAIWQVQTVTWPVPEKRRKFEVGIYLSYDLHCHMTYFCLSYTSHMTYIWHTYGHIPVLYLSYDRYMTGIFLVYTWRLVLRRRTRPHSSWPSSNNIPGPSHDGNLFYIGAMTPFAFAHVNVGGAHIHKESMQTPLLTRCTYEAGCFGCAIWAWLLRRHC